MAITVDYATGVIDVPQADLTPLGGNLYEFDVDAARLAVKAIEASEAGIVFDDTHIHVGEFVLSGATYARLVKWGESRTQGATRSSGLPAYTIEFEETGTPYQITCVGANHNVSDVKVLSGETSLIIGNSAGLVVTAGAVIADDIADAVWDRILAGNHDTVNSAGWLLQKIRSGIATLFAKL